MKKLFIASSLLFWTLGANAQASTIITDKPEVVMVEGGAFDMGSSNGAGNEQPKHSVKLSNYSIGKYPITVGQYKIFCAATERQMPEAPPWGWQDKHPMIKVSYDDAVNYCKWLGQTYGGNWRLPTEAEWEYAARGGNNSRRYIYSGSDDISKAGWFASNSDGRIQPVGRKIANELGLYDMSGNVAEWCGDWFAADYYSQSPRNNPQGPTVGVYRVLRGGCFYETAGNCRVASRMSLPPDGSFYFNGFRVVLSK